MWPCMPQIVQAYEARPPASTHVVGWTSSCCAVAARCSRTRSCVRALWSASVQLLLKDTVMRACIVVCFCAVAAQGHGHACMQCGLLLCSCCSLLKDTVMRACIVVCFTTYAMCSIARKEGVKQALIWTCHKQLHRHTHQSTESTAPH